MNEKTSSTDRELKNYLKTWADRQSPPNEARARLLKSAVNIKTHPSAKPDLHHPITNLPEELFSWALVYCIDRRMAMLRLIS